MVSYLLYKNQIIYNFQFGIIKYLPSIFAAVLIALSFSIYLQNTTKKSSALKLDFFFLSFIILIFQFLSKSELTFLNLFLTLRVPLIILSVIFLSNFLNYKIISSLRKTFFMFLILNGLISLIFGADPFIYYENSDRLRLVFGFVKPSYFCEIIILNLILVFIDYNYNPLPKKFKLITETFVLLFFIFLSGTRTALIVILVFLFLIFVRKIRGVKKIIFLISCLGLILSVVRFSYEIITNTESGRLLIWAHNFSINLKTSLDYFLGTGYGHAVSFVDYNNMRYIEDVGSQFHSDSFYIDTIVQQGFLGLFVFLILFFKLLSLSRGIHHYKAVLFALLTYGVFESVIINITTPFGYISWILIAFLIKVNINQKKIITARVKSLHA